METKQNIVYPSSDHCTVIVSPAESQVVSPQRVFLVQGGKSHVSMDELLKPLQKTRHVFLKQYAKTLKFAFQATNKFQIFNSNGDCIYFAVECTNICTRLFCRGVCPFSLKILSVRGDEVLRISGQPGSCAHAIIKDNRHQLLGTVRKHYPDCCTPTYAVNNFDDIEIVELKGPDGANCCCSWANCGNVDFNVVAVDGVTSLGRISKEWDMTMEDLCGVRFPLKMDARIKALLLGATFLLEFNFYEARSGSCCLNRCTVTLLAILALVGFLLIVTR